MRGPTEMNDVHARLERKLILLNDKNQPIGPTREVVVELSSFLGTLARNALLCPLDILTWRYMDTKDDLWAYTKEKYDIPDATREYCLDVIGSAWRSHKYNLKMLYYKPLASDKDPMSKRPPYVPECQLKELFKYWDSDKHKVEDVILKFKKLHAELELRPTSSQYQKLIIYCCELSKKISETNTKNRKKWKNPHTCGKISFALVRNDLEKKRKVLHHSRSYLFS